MFDIIKRNKIASALIFIILFGLFVAPSECNGVRGWGLCYTKNGYTKNAPVGVENIHLSPLNYILPTPPKWMIIGPELKIPLSI